MYLASQSLRRLISQILSYPNSSVQDEAVEGRVRAEQINNVKRYLTWILLANICNALVLVAALWSSPLRRLAVAWASAIVIVGLYYGLRQRRIARVRPTYVSGAHNQSSNPQFAIARHFVGNSTADFFCRCIARRAGNNCVSLRWHVGWRCIRAGQYPCGGHRVHQPPSLLPPPLPSVAAAMSHTLWSPS